MNTDKNESLLDIAIRLMRSKKKPKSLRELTNEVFQTKGVTGDDIEDRKAQFQVDFMLSGHFVCCGENSKGLKLWDLKSRQPSTLLDKDGSYLEELFSYDEDVIKNELKDEDVYEIKTKSDDELFEDDTDEDDDTDDIEEELGLVVEDDDEETEEVLAADLDDEEIDEPDDDLEDLDLEDED